MKKILVIASMMLLGLSGAHAVGTVAGTPVTNSISLTYAVGGVDQTAVPGNDGDGFVVDKMIDFTLVHADTPKHLVVVPGAENQVRIFTLTNTGNAIQDFNFVAANTSGVIYDGKTDNENVANFEYSLNGTDWYSSAPAINDLAIGGEQTIYVRSDIPAAPTGANGDIMNIILTATAVQDGTSTPEVNTGGTLGVDREDTVDTVLADGTGVDDADYSGTMTAYAGYIIESATLIPTKTSCVISDPVNGTGGTINPPKRIPGAVLRYQIQVANTGTSDATGVHVADTIPAAFGTSAANLEVWTGACPAISSGVCGTKIGTIETNTHTGAGGSSVVLNYEDVAASATNCGYIEVTIQ